MKRHQESKCHRAVVVHEFVIPQCGNVIETANEKEKANMASNRRCFMEILDALQYLGRQGHAIRGDDERIKFYSVSQEKI